MGIEEGRNQLMRTSLKYRNPDARQIVPSTDKPIVQFLEHPEATKPGSDSKETASIG